MSRIPIVVALVLMIGSGACGGQRQSEPAAEGASAAIAADAYRPPADGTASLIASVGGRRDRTSGQVTIDGRLLLPAGARIWVDVYPAGAAAGADPLQRAELYLGPQGRFDAGPFALPAAPAYRVLVTSYFTRSWQPSDVIALVGAGGAKLPKSALRLDRPNAPGMGAHMEQFADVTIGN